MASDEGQAGKTPSSIPASAPAVASAAAISPESAESSSHNTLPRENNTKGAEKTETCPEEETTSVTNSDTYSERSSRTGCQVTEKQNPEEQQSKSQSRSRSRPRSRSGSLLSRSFSHRRSRTWSRASRTQSIADGASPLTRTVSEVRDGILFRRDVELGDIEQDEKCEREGLTLSDVTGNIDLEAGVGGSGGKGGDGCGAAPTCGGAAAAEGVPDESDPNLVKWEGPDDPENPKNWKIGKKWASVFVVSLFTLISPVSSSMIAPALPDLGRDLHFTSTIEELVAMSIFVLAYAIGPLFLGPLSELYGRVIVLQLSNLVYLFFNLGCGLARTRGQMIAFRFLSGFGGSAPLAIGGGVLADLFTAEERGRALSMYSLAPLLGPAIGPIAGAFIAENTTWRWIFYATTIADGIIQTAGLLFLRETYAPILLLRKRNRLRKETGNGALYTAFDKAREGGIARTLRVALSRPFVMLSSQIIVQVLALYMMYLYGILYLQLATFPTLWSDVYHESLGIAGLNYIAPGIGFALGAQVMAPLQDRIYAYLKRRNNVTVGRPEFRVPIMVPGAVLVPAGLLVYGWCAEYHTHWIGPDIGIAMLTFGTIVGFQCIQGYLVDTYTRYAASAVSATTVLRSMAGFGFPLFAPQLYASLGYGKGCTVLAAVGIVIGLPAPFLLYKYGPYLRARKAVFQG